VQVRSRVFDVIVLVLAGSTFGAEHAATMDIFKIAVGELIMPFGLLAFFVIYPEIPFSVLGEPVLSNKFILLLRRGAVFAPRMPLVGDEFTSMISLLACSYAPGLSFTAMPFLLFPVAIRPRS
jgi:hypothetical protein